MPRPSLTRRALIGALTALASCTAMGGPSLTPEQADIVRRVQAWFDGLGVLRARFVEIDPDGASREGSLVFARGGRLRLDYAPRDREVVVADRGRIVALDRSTDAVTRMPARATPLGLLLDGGSVRLRGDGIAVVQALAGPGSIQVSLAPAANRAAGLLTVVFGVGADGSLVLASIQALDDERRRTDFRFFDVRAGGALPPDALDPASAPPGLAG